MDAGFAFPQIEFDAERGEFALQTRFGDAHEMPPQSAIAGPAVLQFHRGAARRLQPGRIGLARRGSRRIELFQILHRDRRLLRVRTFKGGVEIDGRQALDLDFRDQLAHLQPPVADMDIAHHRPAIGAEQPLQAVADHGRAQMTHMHGLGDIGAAEIDQNRFAVGRGRRFRRRDAGIQRRIGEIKIDEARPCDLDLGKLRIGLQPRRDPLGDGAGIGFGFLGRRQRAVALELREIGTVGGLHQAEPFVQPFGGESIPHRS